MLAALEAPVHLFFVCWGFFGGWGGAFFLLCFVFWFFFIYYIYFFDKKNLRLLPYRNFIKANQDIKQIKNILSFVVGYGRYFPRETDFILTKLKHECIYKKK